MESSHPPSTPSPELRKIAWSGIQGNKRKHRDNEITRFKQGLCVRKGDKEQKGKAKQWGKEQGVCGEDIQQQRGKMGQSVDKWEEDSKEKEDTEHARPEILEGKDNVQSRNGE